VQRPFRGLKEIRKMPTAVELIDRATALIPILAQQAVIDEQQRRLSDETISRLKEVGVPRVMQPKRWGGYEMEPGVFAEIQMALGQGDLSTAWIAGVYAGHGYHVALFDERAQREVWSENEEALIASPYAPNGKAVPVAGGFKFSGRWQFSSGCTHSNWILLGGVSSEDPNDARVFLLPRKDYEIIDTWTVMGLEATGSHDIRVEDAFVPKYRTHKFRDGFLGRNPGNDVNAGPLYKVPHMQIFFRHLTSGSIGALQAMLDSFVAHSRQRVGRLGGQPTANHEAQMACARTASAIAEMRSTTQRNFATLMDYAQNNKRPSLRERFLFRFQSAEANDRCVSCAKQLFNLAGGSALYDAMPLQRIYRNMIAARQHAGNQLGFSGAAFGAYMLGLEIQDFML
jgi:3-hydroxy-9,10-secoandrosta-1,3,5(10)-triene-9,17-dione monooxygenase